jgi:UDP-N-acetylglucosamine:LPS N-acetylglucosamine transferase
MKKVVILTIAEGHLSIAYAIEQQIAAQFETKVIEYRIKEFDLYLPLYQLFPSLFKVPYKLSEYKVAKAFAFKMISKKYKEEIFSLLEREQPDCIISTYFLYDQLCVEYGKEHNIPVFNTISNPRTIHTLEACEGSTGNLVFDETAISILENYGIPSEEIALTGWFVREQFRPVAEQTTLRKQLHLLDVLTFLFTTGSEGTSTIIKLLPFLFSVQTPLQVIFICGNNKSLYRSLKLFAKTFAFTNSKSPVKIFVYGFVKNMHEYIAASDLIVGKAGPNSLFESVATHVPFFATTHIAGQEDGNLELIEQYKLGFVEENTLGASKLLKEIAENPSVLDQFATPIEQMAVYNTQSKERFLHVLRQSL